MKVSGEVFANVGDMYRLFLDYDLDLIHMWCTAIYVNKVHREPKPLFSYNMFMDRKHSSCVCVEVNYFAVIGDRKYICC